MGKAEILADIFGENGADRLIGTLILSEVEWIEGPTEGVVVVVAISATANMLA